MITALPVAPLVSGSGYLFTSTLDLSCSQSTNTVTIASTSGADAVIPAATDSYAGVLDAARAMIIDNLATVASSGSYTDLVNQPDRQAIITMIFDGGGSALVAPFTRYLYMPFNATITGWALMADQVGSFSVDIWKVPSGSFPPLVANSITGGSPPNLSSQSSAFTTLIPPSWTTTAINAGDCLAYRVVSAITVQVVTFELAVIH
jgi:hypothetical protein